MNMTNVIHLIPEERDLEKVFFKLGDDWHGFSSESMWAEKISENQFKLRNVPYYAKNISLGDVVAVQRTENQYFFNMVSKRSGHSTYRILINKEIDENLFKRYWEKLENIGCSYEQGKNRLIAVDVPPETNIYEAYKLLEDGEKAGTWDFEEGHCGHPINN